MKQKVMIFFIVSTVFLKRNLLSAQVHKEFRNKLNKTHAKTSTLNEDLNKQ